jgi:galactokinase
MIGLRDLLLRERQRLCDERGLEESDVRGVVSPYRICPIGAHIDHQLGPVLGIAIDAGSALVFAPSDDAFFTVRSADFPGEVRFALPAPGAEGPDRWGTYARAAASVLAHELPEKPIGGVARIAGTLPGAGLGSSASVILAYRSMRGSWCRRRAARRTSSWDWPAESWIRRRSSAHAGTTCS